MTRLLSKTRGAQNVQISVLRRDSGAEWSEVGSVTVKKADGTFEIPAVAPGEYSLLAFSFDDGKAHSTQEDLTVGNADVEGLTVIIGPGVNIPGRVGWEGKPSLEKAGLTVRAAPPGPV